jgi:CheY-like chemotaxis protein
MMASRPLVSVVDDDESLREALPDLLHAFGFAVETFASAEEFLASGRAVESRALILDIAMPGMKGPDLQRELKPRRQEVPIIFITANADIRSSQDCSRKARWPSCPSRSATRLCARRSTLPWRCVDRVAANLRRNKPVLPDSAWA